MMLSDENTAGSSPRARGTPRRTTRPRPPLRFIPAGAGNALTAFSSQDNDPVHPRGRGERRARGTIPMPRCGSSPRARGTRVHDESHLPAGRFIPAGAGNATPARSPRGSSPVHPRGRGERGHGLGAGVGGVGSSPRARGTLAGLPHQAAPDRFIPAGAGNAATSWCGADPWTVHPRGRGERATAYGAWHEVYGSSPRARGTRLRQLAAADAERFIPAGAGNATACFLFLRAVTVHPRGRGERLLVNRFLQFGDGSSPRARGTPRYTVYTR